MASREFQLPGTERRASLGVNSPSLNASANYLVTLSLRVPLASVFATASTVTVVERPGTVPNAAATFIQPQSSLTGNDSRASPVFDSV